MDNITQQRRTIRYRGVKVRYTHKYVRENGFSYTNTDLDEENLRRVKRAYENYIDDKAKRYTRKGQYGKAIAIYGAYVATNVTTSYSSQFPEAYEFFMQAMNDSSYIKELNNQIKQ